MRGIFCKIFREIYVSPKSFIGDRFAAFDPATSGARAAPAPPASEHVLLRNMASPRGGIGMAVFEVAILTN